MKSLKITDKTKTKRAARGKVAASAAPSENPVAIVTTNNKRTNTMMIGASVPVELNARLDSWMATLDVAPSKSAIIAKAITEFLDKREFE